MKELINVAELGNRLSSMNKDESSITSYKIVLHCVENILP